MLQSSAAESYRRRRHRRVDTSTTYQCAVCGDMTRSYNFGVITCQGCKAFFRRHMSHIGKMACLKDNDCDVSKDSRKQCSACRMQKCIAVGMRRDPLTKDSRPTIRKKPSSVAVASATTSTCALSATAVVPVADADVDADIIAANSKLAVRPGASKETVCSTMPVIPIDASDSVGSATTYLACTNASSNSQCSPCSTNAALHLSSPFLLLGQPDSAVYSTDSLSVTPVNVASLHPQQHSLPPPPPLPLPRQPESESASLTDDDDAFADFYAVSSWLTATLGGAQADYQSESENARVTAAVDADKPNTFGGNCGSNADVRVGAGAGVGGSRTPYVPVRAALDAADDSTLSDDVYNEILNNCANLAASQSEPWKRSELDDKLFNEPLIPDISLQMKFLEVSCMRIIQSLKQSRCFKMFNKDEKLALLKASLFSAVPTFVGYRLLPGLQEGFSVGELEDGRKFVKDYRFIYSMFNMFGIDIEVIAARMHELTNLIKSAFPHDWPVFLAAICILMIFPKINQPPRAESDSRFGTTASAFLNAAFEQKVSVVHREHATFLRRFIRSICERDIARGDFASGFFTGITDSTSLFNAAWQFCEDRYQQLAEIGKFIKETVSTFMLKNVSTHITPIIHEVLAASSSVNNADHQL